MLGLAPVDQVEEHLGLFDDEDGGLRARRDDSFLRPGEQALPEPLLQLLKLDEGRLLAGEAAFPADCHRQMGLARTRGAGQEYVLLGLDERQRLQRPQHDRVFPVEAGEIEVVG